MASHDPDELWPKLEEKGLMEVRKLLAQGVYGERKRPVVEEWVHQKEEEKSGPIYMYHPTDAPDGNIFAAHQVSQLEQQGWYDSPSKFPEVKRSRIAALWSSGSGPASGQTGWIVQICGRILIPVSQGCAEHRFHAPDLLRQPFFESWRQATV